MTEQAQHETVLAVFAAIERRDARRLSELFHPAVELIWPDSLPYGAGRGPAWGETWDALQPTAAERRLDPRVVAAAGDEVVVLWWQRGLSPAGERFEDPVLGLYRLREGRLVRAQMFHFDGAAVARFLAAAGSEGDGAAG